MGGHRSSERQVNLTSLRVSVHLSPKRTQGTSNLNPKLSPILLYTTLYCSTFNSKVGSLRKGPRHRHKSSLILILYSRTAKGNPTVNFRTHPQPPRQLDGLRAHPAPHSQVFGYFRLVHYTRIISFVCLMLVVVV